jgi:signal transduction histidine kinase
MARRFASVSTTIVLTSVAVGLSVALLVGWILVMVTRGDTVGQTWLLVIGIVSLAVIIGVLVVSAVLLVREIREGRRQTSFVDSVTHELKSPLASLKLCLETLARPELTAPQLESVREMMRQDVDRLAVFIDDVLAASQLAGAGQRLEMAELSLRDSVNRCAQRICERKRLDPARIRLDIAERLMLVTDRTALEIVLTNLLDNAVKYSEAGQAISVSGRETDDGKILIEVRDAGIGIAARNLAEIFHRFVRVDSEEVRRRAGTGLGLFVVSGLVRRLGGRVKAESAGLGQGTVMRVELPTLARAPERSPFGGAPTPSGGH